MSAVESVLSKSSIDSLLLPSVSVSSCANHAKKKWKSKRKVSPQRGSSKMDEMAAVQELHRCPVAVFPSVRRRESKLE